MNEINRRDFVLFMGRGLALSALASNLQACTTPLKSSAPPFVALRPTNEDTLKLAAGFEFEVLLRYGTVINAAGEKFGYNNDYLAYLPIDPRNPYDGLLWVNHEYHDPYHSSGWRKDNPRTFEQVTAERKDVGGSITHIRRGPSGLWSFVPLSPYNRRLDAFTPIPLRLA